MKLKMIQWNLQFEEQREKCETNEQSLGLWNTTKGLTCLLLGLYKKK